MPSTRKGQIRLIGSQLLQRRWEQASGRHLSKLRLCARCIRTSHLGNRIATTDGAVWAFVP